MSELLPYLAFGVVILVILGLVYYFSEDAKIRRALKKTPLSRIADVRADEVAKIAGRVRPIGPLLRSPLSGRPCVYFQVIVEEYRSSGKSGRWVQIIRETDRCDFLIEDGSGRALIRVGSMNALLIKDVERSSGFLNDAAPDLEALLARHGRSSQGLVFNKSIRYKEGVFEPGETVTVLGSASWEQDPDPVEAGSGYRDAPKRLVMDARPDGPLLASDEPGTA